MKVSMKLGMFSATHERVTVPAGRVKKKWTALRAVFVDVLFLNWLPL